jgi:hypothetical protein
VGLSDKAAVTATGSKADAAVVHNQAMPKCSLQFVLTRHCLLPACQQIMLTGLVIFSGVGTVCGGIIFQWRRSAANRKANMLKVCVMLFLRSLTPVSVPSPALECSTATACCAVAHLVKHMPVRWWHTTISSHAGTSVLTSRRHCAVLCRAVTVLLLPADHLGAAQVAANNNHLFQLCAVPHD